MKRAMFTRAFVAVLAASALTGAGIATAEAVPSANHVGPAGLRVHAGHTPKHSPPKGAKVVKMRVTGVNANLAKAHGFKVVTAPDGSQHAVSTPKAINPDGSPYRAKVHPDDVVEGDCGDSYIWIHPVGGYNMEIQTGFDLDEDAVAYHWQASRSDDYGSDTYSWGGGLAFDSSWEGEWDANAGGPGWETAGVSPSSDALLWDGDICSSGGPTDSAEIV
ncbi:hypothetical protein BFF78_00295 [Streptomyces fodineus]|uniref:Uncharacterized protein n=2 Tax=Streptomyces fodineus TaxID=1904616 RepID=A0A1D7Y2D6_9ACTN|nr:hypothetical protein BFF78_00295 [Streptomyces fodineus]